jgi:hypothetical protein
MDGVLDQIGAEIAEVIELAPGEISLDQTPSSEPWPTRDGLLCLSDEESPMLRKVVIRQRIDLAQRKQANLDALGFELCLDCFAC